MLFPNKCLFIRILKYFSVLQFKNKESIDFLLLGNK